MANIDKVSVKNTVYNIVSPAVVSDYIEVIGGACTKPDGYVEDEVILAKQNDVQLLFKATQTIAFGANIVENTNCIRTTLEEILKSSGGGGASSADQVSYDNSESGLEAENVQEAVDELATKAGTASSQIQTLTQEITEESAIRDVLGAKNIFPNKLASGTSLGVTFVNNGDGTITANGTFSEVSPVLLSNGWSDTDLSWITPFIGKKIRVKCGVVGIDFAIRFYDSDNTNIGQIESGYNGTWGEDTVPSGIHHYAAYLFPSGTITLTDALIFPRADYEPYAMTNQEMTPYVQAISNPNLLDNPWFTVNQRGQSSYSGNVYGYDRWIGANNSSVESDTNGVKIINTLWQRLESDFITKISGKSVTLSVLLGDGTIYSASGIASSANGTFITIDNDVIDARFIKDNYYTFVHIHPKDSSGLVIRAVKLELGSVSTLAQDTAPNYATELLKCQRYFQRIKFYGSGKLIGFSFANANKTNVWTMLPIATPMRATPSSINISDLTKIKITSNTSWTGSQVPTSLVFHNLEGTNFYLTWTVANDFTAGEGVNVQSTDDVYIDLNANL